MTDRMEQARAEADELYGHLPFGAMRSGLMGGHAHGAAWAFAQADASTEAMLIVDPKDMKSLGEALRVAEQVLNDSDQYRHNARHITALIRQVDEHRPTGPDGKHDDRHTLTCGCED